MTVLSRKDESGNNIIMHIINGEARIHAWGPEVHESADEFVEHRNDWSEPEKLTSLDHKRKEFDIIAAAFFTHIQVTDTPYDYEDSRDAGKTWMLWERVAQALGYENVIKEYIVY